MLTTLGMCSFSRRWVTFICAVFFLAYVIAFAAKRLAPKSFRSFAQLNVGVETDFVLNEIENRLRWEQMNTMPPPTEDKTQRTTCQPKNRIVYVRVPQTGSETVASMLDRYGWSHGLSFVIPRNKSAINFKQPFTKEQVYGVKSFENGFDMLTSRAGYNRPDMLAMVPNATFITTIRDPVKQFESAFKHFGYAEQLGLTHKKDPLQAFLRQTEKLPYLDKLDYVEKLTFGKIMGKNGQIRYLGLDGQRQDAPFFIDEKIQKLAWEFDFVMLTDYLDESLLVLKRLLCWTMDDILFISKNVGSTSGRYKVRDKAADMIRQWNYADMRLYDHFNSTLWCRVKQYGKHFKKDLKEFRRRQEKLNKQCSQELVEDPGEFKQQIWKGNDGKCPNWMFSPRKFSELNRNRMRHLVMGPKKEREPEGMGKT